MFEGDDYIGFPVNVAARLCDQAQPHQVLATVEVASQRPGWIGAEPGKSVVVRGLQREVEARALFLADPGQDPVVDPVCSLAIPRALSIGTDPEPRFCSDACSGSWDERVPAPVS